MRAGDLRRRIILQNNVPIQNSMGEMVDAWTDFKTLWGDIEPLTGKRVWEAMEAQAEVDGIIHIRYCPGITATMRVKFGTRIFKIQAVKNVDERNIELLIYYHEIQP